MFVKVDLENGDIRCGSFPATAGGLLQRPAVCLKNDESRCSRKNIWFSLIKSLT